MDETSVSLLERVRRQSDPASWRRLLELYMPLLGRWLRRYRLPDADAEDVAQEVLAVVVRRLPEFEHSRRTGAFRAWLRAILANCLRDYWRARKGRPVATGDADFLKALEELEDPASGQSRAWDLEHDRYVVGRLLELLRPHFEPNTWRAFERVTQDGLAPAAVAAELGISVNAVLVAKSRVLRRLRQETRGLTD